MSLTLIKSRPCDDDDVCRKLRCPMTTIKVKRMYSWKAPKIVFSRWHFFFKYLLLPLHQDLLPWHVHCANFACINNQLVLFIIGSPVRAFFQPNKTSNQFLTTASIKLLLLRGFFFLVYIYWSYNRTFIVAWAFCLHKQRCWVFMLGRSFNAAFTLLPRLSKYDLKVKSQRNPFFSPLRS